MIRSVALSGLLSVCAAAQTPPVEPQPAAADAIAQPPAPSPEPSIVVPEARAEPEIPKSQPPELVEAQESLGWALVRTMVVLGLVVALVYLTLNVGLRKLLGIRPVVGTSVVTVLERVPLDQKRTLFVVEAAGEVMLLGGSDGGVNLVAKLDRAEVDRIRAASGPSSPVQLSPFLQKLLGRKDVPPPVP